MRDFNLLQLRWKSVGAIVETEQRLMIFVKAPYLHFIPSISIKYVIYISKIK